MYYWLTFLNKVRIKNFRHFFASILKQISQASFFMILTIFWLLSIVDPVPSKDMQTLLLSFAPIFMKDAQCVELNEKSIFRY